MSISFSPAKFVQRVLALGPEFLRYGAALGGKKTVDSTFLQNLADHEIEMLFAFIPQAHQVKLETFCPKIQRPCRRWRITLAMTTESCLAKPS
jgi:hypothetical protein